jgi:hypothetical protein
MITFIKKAIGALFRKKSEAQPKPPKHKGLKVVESDKHYYVIDARSYGYNHFRLSVNGESSDIIIPDTAIKDISSFSKLAKEAIQEYKARHARAQAFADWDGKL